MDIRSLLIARKMGGNSGASADTPSDAEAKFNALLDRSLTEISSNMTVIKEHVFYYCRQLTNVDFPLATSIGGYAFYGDEKLTVTNFPLVTSVDAYAFYYCIELGEINLPLATNIGESAFRYCKLLTKVNFPLATKIGNQAFQNCTSLVTVDFPKVTSIGNQAFQYCSNLTRLILRSETMCNLVAKGAFTNTPMSSTSPTGYIYVPSALIDSYKTGTNWSNYASQFRALEDYTVDGTITGELDETKI